MLFMEFTSSFGGIPTFSLEPLSPPVNEEFENPVKIVKTKGPFSGLVICVTGLSKETRKQVQEATERLGGQYSPHLHPQCTHLVVQSFHGPKFEHAMKHGTTNGLFLVTIGWFVDSIKRNVRLNETPYRVDSIRDNGLANNGLKQLDQNSGAENSSLSSGLLKLTKQPDFGDASASQFLERQDQRQTASSFLAGQSFYVDLDIPAELRTKVAEALSAEGATLLDQWFVGCNATHVVSEESSVQKYLGHTSNIVTPLWVLKSAKEKSLQRLVHLSADLARYTGIILDTFQNGVSHEGANSVTDSTPKSNHEERQMKVNLAKDGVRKRRNCQMQTCHTPIRPITPGILLDSICWSVSELTSTASIYTESSAAGNAVEDQTSIFFDGKGSEASFVNHSRPLTESEKSELILKGHFLTIMFPVDRFSEMGPRSRTFFSNRGFTCLQVLDYVYAFYQEKMSSEEIEVAIHTDSKHADRLRSIYSSKGTADPDQMELRRIDFVGSRKSFEMLKRVAGDNNSNLYELLMRA